MTGSKYDGFSVHSSINIESSIQNSMSKEDYDDSKESRHGKVVNLPPLHKYRKDQ